MQYIVDHSEALLVVSSPKFDAKAKELLASELTVKPTHVALVKHLGSSVHEKVELDEGQDAGKAGMMLYTSGTTNRPVRATEMRNWTFCIPLTLSYRRAFCSRSGS